MADPDFVKAIQAIARETLEDFRHKRLGGDRS